MRIFQCGNCQFPIYFENTTCLNCGYALGYHSEYDMMVPLQRDHEHWTLIPADGQTYRYCANYQHDVCNWILPTGREQEFCEACALNRTIPHLNSEDNLTAWHQLEKAKHRLIYGLKQLGLPVVSKNEQAETGLAFDFLSDEKNEKGEKNIKTGHANGLITINLAEADSVHREWIRRKLSEPYRTLIGHFRHEVGHYYWDRLVQPYPDEHAAFHRIFGDETQDYAQSLETYYQNGADPNWQQSYISQYATAHPWEDWAETWAHYLHVMDTVETAYSFGLSLHPSITYSDLLKSQATFDPHSETNFDRIIDAFISITFAINSFNRGMGLSDVYPFVIAPAVKEKLRFIHKLVLPYSAG
ncbi:MAG: putative zinc-binding peptidase [Saprospiraceae bacterium]|nr:putative zinc-binding peptidase [Lewinella sp.]